METIWYGRVHVPTPLGLAVQLGWIRDEFEADGLSVRALEDGADPSQWDSYYDHHVPNSFRQGGNAPAIWARSQGSRTRVIGLNWIDESQLVATLPDSGIRHPRELNGRRLALPSRGKMIDSARAGALRTFIVALELGGLTYKDVEFIDLPEVQPEPPGGGAALPLRPEAPAECFATSIHALIRREVDAIYLKGAAGLQLARQLRLRVIADLRDHPDPLVRSNNAAPRPLTVDQALLDQRPDIAARFLARVVAVGAWARAHPAEAVAYVARETRSNDFWVRQAYGCDVFRRLNTNLDDAAIAGLEAYKKFLLEWGFLKSDFDIWGWIDPQPLEQCRTFVLPCEA
ncbi:ABC transporter substrate-binding protein [Thauera sinica]|uniref:ABC transporter substrate-binding protein n=1 Tax=Thauera sinica TaxID=2665146 RepID=A0ABW1AMI9_9RHOO|nr:ABC transporter substrate-binding protein [Thauera sp. K11]ATE59175.1 nitrate ABC transporter substrate-binding protein [Thauera sp. K11]